MKAGILIYIILAQGDPKDVDSKAEYDSKVADIIQVRSIYLF